MDSGEILGVVLIVFLLGWGIADFVVWQRGKQTFSQWIIEEGKKRLSFALMVLTVITGIFLWLVIHWELPQIILGHL